MSNDQKLITVTVRDGAAPGTYDVSFDPDRPTVRKKNTQMVYQFSDDTPAGIRFTGSSARPAGQMGPATVGNHGRSIAFNNANSKKGKVDVQLDMEASVSFYALPEVVNDPQPE